MIVKVSPREAEKIFDLLCAESGLAFNRGKHLESDYLKNLAKKFKGENETILEINKRL